MEVREFTRNGTEVDSKYELVGVLHECSVTAGRSAGVLMVVKSRVGLSTIVNCSGSG